MDHSGSGLSLSFFFFEIVCVARRELTTHRHSLFLDAHRPARIFDPLPSRERIFQNGVAEGKTSAFDKFLRQAKRNVKAAAKDGQALKRWEGQESVRTANSAHNAKLSRKTE